MSTTTTALPLSDDDITSTKAWITRYYASTDLLNPAPYVRTFFAPDAEMFMANNPPRRGHAEIIKGFEGMMGVLGEMRHEVTHIDVLPTRIYVSVTNTYLVKDDESNAPIVIRALGVFHKIMREEQLRRIDIYGDFTPVLARVKAVAARREGEEVVTGTEAI